MRLRPIAPSDLTDRQRVLHEQVEPVLQDKLTGFVSKRSDGALVGPFAPMLRWPAWGEGAWSFTQAMIDHTVLPKPAHEVAILVTGAKFRALYELYAHERVAQDNGLAEAKVATVVAGQRPADLNADESAAYDLATAAIRGGAVPDATYAAAVDQFGEEGAAELVFLVALYAAVSVLLNGFAMPVPDDAA